MNTMNGSEKPKTSVELLNYICYQKAKELGLSNIAVVYRREPTYENVNNVAMWVIYDAKNKCFHEEDVDYAFYKAVCDSGLSCIDFTDVYDFDIENKITRENPERMKIFTDFAKKAIRKADLVSFWTIA